MKNKKENGSKIINTICLISILCLFIYGFARFIFARNAGNEEAMLFWLSSVCITAAVIFILWLTLSLITQMWSNDDEFETIYKPFIDALIKSKEDLYKQLEQKEKEIKKLKKGNKYDNKTIKTSNQRDERDLQV